MGVLKLQLADGSYVEIPIVSDHGQLTGLGDVGDHAGYILVDGSRAWTGNQSFGTDKQLRFRSAANHILSPSSNILKFVSPSIVLDGDVTVNGTHKANGFFGSIIYQGQATSTASSGYLFKQTGTRGFVAEEPGSIVSFGTSGECTTLGLFASYDIEVRVDGVNTWELNLNCESTGDKTDYGTQARGAKTFTAGQVISFYADENGVAVMSDIGVNARVQYD